MRPEETLMIGDSLVDVETGKRAGVKTCGVTYGHAGRESLESAQPDWIIDDLLELKQFASLILQAPFDFDPGKTYNCRFL